EGGCVTCSYPELRNRRSGQERGLPAQRSASARRRAGVLKLVRLPRFDQLAVVGRGIVHRQELDGLTRPGVELLARVAVDLDLVAILAAHDDQRIFVVPVLLADLFWRSHVSGQVMDEATRMPAGTRIPNQVTVARSPENAFQA